MARPRGSKNKPKEQNLQPDSETNTTELTQEQPDFIWPNGVMFGVVQLPRDLASGKFATQRIVQTVNENGKLSAYITESSYHRSELKPIFDMLFRKAYAAGISKGAASLLPVKERFHWRAFEPGFLSGTNTDTPRLDPTTGEFEK